MEQSIDAAHDLGARVILLAFFSNGDLLDANERVKQADVDAAVERIKAAAPRAKDAGVILGIENYLNGEQNARILDRINHESVQLYFDVYNTGTTKRHNVPADIRRLKGRIAQFHFKNGDKYLDAEKAKFEPIAATIKEIGYEGWIVLETSSPSNERQLPTPEETATTSARSSPEWRGQIPVTCSKAHREKCCPLFDFDPPDIPRLELQRHVAQIIRAAEVDDLDVVDGRARHRASPRGCSVR